MLEPAPHAKGGAQRISVYVATNRTPKAGSSTVFTAGRSDALRYARYVISIPPTHRRAEIEWPKGAPDASTDFVTIEAAGLPEPAFRAASARPRVGERDGDVRLFVHGYNYNFQESVYRPAQLAADAKSGSSIVVFAWPSKGDFLSYDDDQNVAAASRDQVARVIDMLAAARRGRLVLVSHSMGSWLTMEALVRLRQQGRGATLKNLKEVVLAAPNISVEDFIRQLDAIGPLPTPLTMLVSKDDEALGLSRLIAGGRDRVGAADIGDPRVQAAARRYGVRIVDISELSSAEGFNHDRYAAMAALYPKFRDQIEKTSSPEFAGAGTFVFNVRTSKLSRVDWRAAVGRRSASLSR